MIRHFGRPPMTTAKEHPAPATAAAPSRHPAAPVAGQLTLEDTTMTEIRLTCISSDAAAAVVKEHDDYFGAGPSNTIRQDGRHVVIDYYDKRWPLDITEWAGEQGHAHDDDAARVIAQL